MGVLQHTPSQGRDRVEELKEGDLVGTPDVDTTILQTPPWLDKEKFYRAGELYRRYFASVNFSHLCGLLLSFYFSKNIETLRSTGMSNNTKNLFYRYLATTRYVQAWYEGDVWDPKDKAHKSLALVRSMHSNVASKMASKGDGVVYVSQWDMALTQWAFVGPMVLFSSQVGLHGLSEKDFDALIHFWRGIGYLLGIEDRYNLCDGSYSDVIRACEDMLRKEYAVKVSEADPVSVSMCSDTSKAFNKMDPLLTWGFLSHYIHDLINIPCPIEMSFYDWICYEVTKFMMRVACKYPIGRLLINEISRWRLDKAESEKGPYGRIKIAKLSSNVSAKAA